jgi:hypothetical protein
MRIGRLVALMSAVAFAQACGATSPEPPAPSCPGGTDAAPSTGELRFDGVYQHIVSDYSQYLRFYDDRTVIAVSAKGSDPSQLASWFHKGSSIVGTGTYTLNGAAISFTSTATEGSVAYQGLVCIDSVSFKVHSMINGNRATSTYSFAAVAFTE